MERIRDFLFSTDYLNFETSYWTETCTSTKYLLAEINISKYSYVSNLLYELDSYFRRTGCRLKHAQNISSEVSWLEGPLSLSQF